MAAKKENADKKARLYPSTYKRLRIRSVKEDKTIAELVDVMEKEYAKK